MVWEWFKSIWCVYVFIYGKMIGKICWVSRLYDGILPFNFKCIYLICYTIFVLFSSFSLVYHTCGFYSFMPFVYIFRSIWPHDMPIICFCFVARPPFSILFVCLFNDVRVLWKLWKCVRLLLLMPLLARSEQTTEWLSEWESLAKLRIWKIHGIWKNPISRKFFFSWLILGWLCVFFSFCGCCCSHFVDIEPWALHSRPNNSDVEIYDDIMLK